LSAAVIYLKSEVVTMRITLIVPGVLLMCFGVIWFLQGIGVLPGSFMTGQMQWAVYGGIAFVVGVFVLYRAWRMRRPPQR
jgi:uncharacterized membrane protein